MSRKTLQKYVSWAFWPLLAVSFLLAEYADVLPPTLWYAWVAWVGLTIGICWPEKEESS